MKIQVKKEYKVIRNSKKKREREIGRRNTQANSELPLRGKETSHIFFFPN